MDRATMCRLLQSAMARPVLPDQEVLRQRCKVNIQFYYPITRQQILDWSKLKQSADNSFKFDENIKEFSKRVENTVGKGEIARYEQFLLLPQCFLKVCFPGASKGVIVWEWVIICMVVMLMVVMMMIKTTKMMMINLLPDDKILDWSKLKALADDKLKVAKMMIVLFNRAEYTVGKGENAGYQHFLLFPQCFPKPSSLG